MHVLVVGGAGYIGSHVVSALRDEQHQVTVLDDMSTGREENLFEDAPFIKASILDAPALERVFQAGAFDAVIHLAALKAAGDSMHEPEIYGHHNITGSINLINAAAAGGVRKLVFSSSAAVYGEPNYLPMDEQHPIAPENFYGFTKIQIERHLRWFSQLRGLRSACLRYFNAAGYDPTGKITGLEINPKNLIPVVMEVAMGAREQLQIFGNDYPTEDGTCIRDYVHVTDLAKAHVASLGYLDTEDKDLVLNLGSETGHSVLDVVNMAAQVVGKPIPHKFVARREGDPAKLVASSKVARQRINWAPQYSSLESLIATSWEVYRNQ